MDASTRLTCFRNTRAPRLPRAVFFAAVMFSLAVLLGCASISSDPGTVAASAQAEAFFCGVSSVECRSGTADFEIDQLRDLFIFVAWRGVRGMHSQEVRLLLPDGNLYQALDTKFTTQQGLAAMDGVQVAQLSRGEPTVVSFLPVAGTFITQRLLSGTWRIQVSLDGKLVTETTFELRPARQ